MHHWWHSWGKRATVIAGSVLGAFAAFVFFCLVTPPGHRVLASLIEPLSGDSVAMTGLAGNLPNHLQAERVELRDENGVWLRADVVRLDWHFLSLLGNHVDITRLRADRVAVLRREVPSKTTTTSTTIVDVTDLAIGRIELNPSVLGRPAILTVSGSLHYASRHDVAADLTIRRLDGQGLYDVHAAIVHDIAQGAIKMVEGGEGVAGGAIGMPDLGPVTLDVRASAKGSNNTIHFQFGADLLDVSGDGTLDLATEQADIDFSAVAPAMHPNKQLSWSSLSAKGHFHGSFTRPEIDANLKIAGLVSNGNRIGMLQAAVNGTGGNADLRATATDLHLAGEKKTAVFASSPVVIAAHADLMAPDRLIRFELNHPLLRVVGQTTGRTPMTGKVSLTLPSLEGLAPLTGVKLSGNAHMAIDFKQGGTGGQLKADGTIAARGDTALARLLGGNAKLAATVSMRDAQNLSLRASLKGAAASAQAGGSVSNGKQDFSGELSISDLSRAVTSLVGTLTMRGRLTGPQGNAKLAANGTAFMGTKGVPKQSVTITAQAEGLPKLKAANVHVSGRFDDSPVSLTADIADAGDDTVKIALTDASWRSAHAQGSIAVTGSQPRGTVALHVAKLADLSPLVGTALAGTLDARTDFQTTSAVIHATGRNIASGETRIDRVEVSGAIADPLGRPSLALTIAVPQLATSAVSGSANARLNGPLNALAINLTSAMATTEGQNFSFSTDAVVDTVAKHVSIGRFEGIWRDQVVKLAAPAQVDYADGLKFAATFVEGKAMQLTVAGTVPSKPGQSMNVRANGTADLAVIGSGLAAVGQSVRGKAVLNVTVTGTAAKPQVVGSATVTGGQIQDYGHGLNLTDVEAAAEAHGSDIHLTKFTAKAGSGTISGAGTIYLAAPGTPVDITFKAANARPIASDLISVALDSEVKLEGHLSEGLRLTGQVRIRQGNINIPEKFPTEVATLNVRRGRQTALPPPPPSPARITLDLTVVSPGRTFVRGRGLEAEFEGDLKIEGTTGAPRVLGALSMRRGTLSLAGTNLTFQSGRISFNGDALRERLDPSLDFVAQTEANGVTATLKVTGTASQPRIELSSSPQLPQDEILAQLLFQQSVRSLSAMQLASLAQAAASLGGGGVGFDPVGAMRNGLGLDRLAVGSTPGANGGSGSTTVEAGKYVLHNVYLAARQDLSGGTRALVQVDLTKHLKAQAQVNTGPRAATTTSSQLQDNGDSIGLSYQFDY
jgi:translocation and assembly module TamB